MDKLTIDINCDLGEGCGNDAELMKYISSANIACGYHAGDADTMKRTVDLAIKNGVAIGAHPGYDDRENFGRTNFDLPSKEIYKIVIDQIAALDEIATSRGAKVAHVKPHGAMYNQSAKNAELAAAIAEAVRDVKADLILFGLSGSLSIDEAAKIGLRTASEVFGDRTYQTDGSLTPRDRSNALITDDGAATGQVLDMIKYGRVRSTDAVMVKIVAETVCIHGDGSRAVEFARAIKQQLEQNGISVEAMNGGRN